MTIKDIAKACGVSVSTVSRVLNDHPDVSQSVRDRVRSTVERMGYIPNNSARDLVRSQSDNIGVVVRGQDNLFFSAMVKTISREIERRGYTMVLHFIGSDGRGHTGAGEKAPGAHLPGRPFRLQPGDPLPGGRTLPLLHLHQLLRQSGREGLLLGVH